MTRLTTKELFLGAVLIVLIILKLFSTPITDPNFYPFVFGDTWQYLSQGMHYLGKPTPNYYRPALLPIIFSLFYKIGAEKYLGFIPQFFSVILIISLFIITNKLFGRTVAFLTTFLVLANKQIFISSYYLNADILCVSLITLSIAMVLLEKEWGVIPAWCITALSFYAQNAFFAPWFLIITLFFVQGKLFYKRKSNIIGMLTFCIMLAIYFIVFFNYTHAQFRNLQLVKFTNLSYIAYYGLGILFELHYSGIFLMLIGGFSLLKPDKEKLGFLLLWFFPAFVFFTFFYDTPHQRFILYYSMPLMIMMGYGLYTVIEKLKLQFVKIIIIIIVMLFQNTPGFTKSLAFYNTAMAIGPHLTVKKDLTLIRERNMPVLWQLLRADITQLASDTKYINYDPSVTNALNKFLHHTLNKDEFFTVFPLYTGLRGMFAQKIQALSMRQGVEIKTINDLDDPALKVFIYFDRPEKNYSLEEYVFIENIINYIETSGVWELHKFNKQINIYIKKH